MNPIVIAHHLIWTAYGTWLPNDPRGSGSVTIRNNVLAEIGDLHFGRKKAQPGGKVVKQFYESAAELCTAPLKLDQRRGLLKAYSGQPESPGVFRLDLSH